MYIFAIISAVMAAVACFFLAKASIAAANAKLTSFRLNLHVNQYVRVDCGGMDRYSRGVIVGKKPMIISPTDFQYLVLMEDECNLDTWTGQAILVMVPEHLYPPGKEEPHLAWIVNQLADRDYLLTEIISLNNAARAYITTESCRHTWVGKTHPADPNLVGCMVCGTKDAALRPSRILHADEWAGQMPEDKWRPTIGQQAEYLKLPEEQGVWLPCIVNGIDAEGRYRIFGKIGPGEPFGNFTVDLSRLRDKPKRRHEKQTKED